MPSKRVAPLLVAGFALFFNYAAPQVASGQLRRPPTLEEMTRPQVTAPQAVPAGPQAQCVATSTQRIDRGRMEIRVYRNGRPVELFSHFHELVTATPAGRQKALDQLAGRSITLVPSGKQWNVFTGVGGVGELVLADNIFKVRQVLLSSRKNLIEVHVDGEIHRLQPGQALLVL